MPLPTSGASGDVQYDLDMSCFSDEHRDAVRLVYAQETSDQGNPIFECPECGIRRAANVTVNPLRAVGEEEP